MRHRKPYAYTRDPDTGKRVLLHRQLAEKALGRSLAPKEVVHHRDGNSLNNDLSNLIVLPDQRFHAHAEFHGRRVRSGMIPLFPEYFQGIPESRGSLFDHVLVFTLKESPPAARRQKKHSPPEQIKSPSLFEDMEPNAVDTSRYFELVVPADPVTSTRGSRYLRELLAELKVQVTVGDKEFLCSFQELNIELKEFNSDG